MLSRRPWTEPAPSRSTLWTRDAVLCYGVLMYLESPVAAIAELAAGLRGAWQNLAIAARSASIPTVAPVASPGLGRCLPRAFDEVNGHPGRPIPTLCQRNRISARADTIEDMTSLCEAAGPTDSSAGSTLRVATDNEGVSPRCPQTRLTNAIFDIEERLGGTNP